MKPFKSDNKYILVYETIQHINISDISDICTF